MAVYTQVSAAELEAFLAPYDCGRLVDFAGIAAGIENTNYRVTTTRGRFVLTLLEQTPADDLDFCLHLMAHLADNDLPSARPLAPTGEGAFVRTLHDKPAVLVEHLKGHSVMQPDTEHCRSLGAAVARMHLATGNFARRRENERGRRWHEQTARRVRPHLDRAGQVLLDDELEHYLGAAGKSLASGVIHADLFRDNVFFDHHRLSGLLDFYYAHTGPLIYDLAVCVSDWCFDPETGFHLERARALLRAYATLRPVDAVELQTWSSAVRAAGLRFWLSRVHDATFPRPGEITHIKDPTWFRVLLERCRDEESLEAMWM